jgi:hypothetical protein
VLDCYARWATVMFGVTATLSGIETHLGVPFEILADACDYRRRRVGSNSETNQLELAGSRLQIALCQSAPSFVTLLPCWLIEGVFGVPFAIVMRSLCAPRQKM